MNIYARPHPPVGLAEGDALMLMTLKPAPEVGEWVQRAIVADDGPLYNPDHSHLIDAKLCFLWASSAFTKQGRTVLGQCEQVMLRVVDWQKVVTECLREHLLPPTSVVSNVKYGHETAAPLLSRFVLWLQGLDELAMSIFQTPHQVVLWPPSRA